MLLGFQTIPKAGIRWVYLSQLRAHILNMHAYINACIKCPELARLRSRNKVAQALRTVHGPVARTTHPQE